MALIKNSVAIAKVCGRNIKKLPTVLLALFLTFSLSYCLTITVATTENLDGVAGSRVYAIAVDPSDADSVYAVTTNGVFRSDDNAKSWKRLGYAPSDEIGEALAIDPSDRNIVYVSDASGSGALFKSTDQGGTWQTFNFSYPQVSSISVGDTGTVYAGTLAGDLNRIENGVITGTLGLGFQGSRIRAIATSPNNAELLYAVVDGKGLLRSTDGGVSWRQSDNGLPSHKVTALTLDRTQHGKLYAAIGKGAGIFVTDDGGGSWRRFEYEHPDTRITSLAVSPSGELLYIGTPSGVITVQITEEGAGVWSDSRPSLDVQQLTAMSCALSEISDGDVIGGELGTDDCFDSAQRKYVDRFVFNGERGQRADALLTQTTYDDRIAIFSNATGRVVTRNDGAVGGQHSWVSVALPTSGSYTIEVSSTPRQRTGAYTLRFNLGCPPEAIDRGDTVNGTLGAEDCKTLFGHFAFSDRYTFNASRGQRVEFQITNSNFAERLGFYQNATGRRIASINSTSRKHAQLRITIPVDGSYTVEVTSVKAYTFGAYSLMLR